MTDVKHFAGRGPRGATAAAQPRRFSLTRNTLWVLPALGLLLIALVWLGTFMQLRAVERAHVATVARDTVDLVESYEQYTRNAIEAADRMALVVKYDYEQHGASDLQGLTRAGIINGNSVGRVVIFDARGDLVASSQPMRRVNIDDRAYFRAHMERDTGRLDVSQPVISKTTGQWAIQLSRRINHRDGSFAGIVLLSVAPEYFTRLYADTDLGSRGTLAMIGLDGVLRTHRVGSVSNTTDDGTGQTVVAHARNHARGYYEEAGADDGVVRLVAYRELPDYPFVVAAGAARDDALAGLAADRVQYLAAATIATIVILLFFSVVTVMASRLQRNRRALTRERRFLKTVVDNIPAGISVRSMRGGDSGRFVLWNEACEAIFTVPASEALGKTLEEMVSPEVSAPLIALDAEMLASPMVQETSEVIDVPNRGMRTFHLVRAPAIGPDDNVDYIMSIATDVTDERARIDELRLASKVFETTADGIMLSDRDDRVIRVNAAFVTLTGYTLDDMEGQRVADSAFRPTDPDDYAVRLERLHREGFVTGEVQRIAKDGTPLSLWITATCVRDATGEIVNYVRVFSDISLLKATQQKLEELASHDALTGLPNRRLLQDRLAQSMLRAERGGASMALMFLDLDGFKNVNDTLGHDAGDELLRQVAARLGVCIRAVDSLARFGGDEFAIVLDRAALPQDAIAVAERVLGALKIPFDLGGQRASVGASIGIAQFPVDGTDVTTLLKSADAAMYRAKKGGRNRFVFHTPPALAQSLACEPVE